MNVRNELISQALRHRFKEVCNESICKLEADQFGNKSWLVSRLQERFSNPAATVAVPTFHQFKIVTWSTSGTDCFSALMKLAAGQSLTLDPDPNGDSPVSSFLDAVHDARNIPDRVVTLTADRYACPLNFGLPQEMVVREYVLERLMVQSRAKAERAVLKTSEAQDVLLKLNLIAANVASINDLRFLDALNYYYELLLRNRQPHFQHNWLLVSYLGLYAQALAAWLSRE